MNIYDYCGGTRATAGWKFYLTCMTNGEIDTNTAQKTLRYYMSKKGCKILKVNGDRTIKVEASKSLERIMNKFEKKEFDDYEIDFQFYLREINKEINRILPSQQSELNF